ncbi:MAG: hypothetical protein LM580_03935 [Thermofilum sp.]|jgi:hypothetical protein|nr:hypothetical protein [Thermofilum sp.]
MRPGKVWWVVGAAAAVAALLLYWVWCTRTPQVEVRPLRVSVFSVSKVVVEREETEFIIRGLEDETSYADCVDIAVYELVAPVIEVRLSNGTVLPPVQADRLRVRLQGNVALSVIRIRGLPKEAGRQVLIVVEVEQGRARRAFPIQRPIVAGEYWKTEMLFILSLVLAVALAAALAYILVKRGKGW